MNICFVLSFFPVHSWTQCASSCFLPTAVRVAHSSIEHSHTTYTPYTHVRQHIHSSFVCSFTDWLTQAQREYTWYTQDTQTHARILISMWYVATSQNRTHTGGQLTTSTTKKKTVDQNYGNDKQDEWFRAAKKNKKLKKKIQRRHTRECRAHIKKFRCESYNREEEEISNNNNCERKERKTHTRAAFVLLCQQEELRTWSKSNSLAHAVQQWICVLLLLFNISRSNSQ